MKEKCGPLMSKQQEMSETKIWSFYHKKKRINITYQAQIL